VKIVVYYNSSGLKLHRQLKCAQTFWMIALRCLIQHKRLRDNIQLHTDVGMLQTVLNGRFTNNSIRYYYDFLRKVKTFCEHFLMLPDYEGKHKIINRPHATSY
jgi:hypothetical protein